MLQENISPKFYRIKESCEFDIYEFHRINGSLPFEYLEEITEDEFFRRER